MALGEYIGLLLLRQKLDLDPLAHSLPGLVEQRFLQLREPSLGRANEIVDRRIGLPHLRQHGFGGNAAIHHPDPPGFAVLRFDLLQKTAQCRAVGKHLVGERKAVRRHKKSDHDLNAVGALVAAIAIAAFIVLIGRRRRFEIGAGQVIEQYVEARAKQILPALAQMRKQRLLVRQNLIQATVQTVLCRQRKVGRQQIRHGTLLEPLPMRHSLPGSIRR